MNIKNVKKAIELVEKEGTLGDNFESIAEWLEVEEIEVMWFCGLGRGVFYVYGAGKDATSITVQDRLEALRRLLNTGKLVRH